MRQRIVNREYYRHSSCPRNSRGSVCVTLACGCDKHYKCSAQPKGDWAHCFIIHKRSSPQEGEIPCPHMK